VFDPEHQPPNDIQKGGLGERRNGFGPETLNPMQRSGIRHAVERDKEKNALPNASKEQVEGMHLQEKREAELNAKMGRGIPLTPEVPKPQSYGSQLNRYEFGASRADIPPDPGSQTARKPRKKKPAQSGPQTAQSGAKTARLDNRPKTTFRSERNLVQSRPKW
jgi:hypothetical protein